jgi:hypothetical protein
LQDKNIESEKEGEDNNVKVMLTSMMFYFHVMPFTIYLSFGVIHVNPYALVAT